jgi:hypothetical protein
MKFLNPVFVPTLFILTVAATPPTLSPIEENVHTMGMWPRVSSMNRQDHVARNDKAHGSAEEGVARKVITCSNAREADGPG